MNGDYSTGRPAGLEHVPAYPKGFVAIRIVQLVLAVIILGLDAYTLSWLSFSGNQLNMFTAIITIIIAIYCIVVHFSAGAQRGYNYWAVLGLDIFALVFWLIGFALLAAQVAPYVGSDFCDYYYDSCTSMLFPAMAAVAGLGGLEFILFIVSLAIHSVAMHRHRAAGLHCEPASRSHGNTNATNNIPLGGPVTHQGEKQQTQATYTAAPIPQQQQQQQQQYASPTSPQGQAPPAGVVVSPPQPGYHHQQQQHINNPAGQQQQAYEGPAAPHAGSYEAPGQAAGGQQQY